MGTTLAEFSRLAMPVHAMTAQVAFKEKPADLF
jgi:hypothetical protein